MSLNKLKKRYQAGQINKEEYITQMHKSHQHLFQYADLIEDTDIDTLEIRNREIVIKTQKRDIQLFASRTDMRIAPMEMLNFGFYDENELDIIEKLIPEDVVFFDIGANVGWYSLNIAKMKKDACIYAFEPIPKTFDALRKNIQLNNMDGISIHPIGFSNKTGTLVFYYYPEVSGNASLANLSNRHDVENIDCRVIRLDDFIKEYTGRNIDFIKCDVEGAELSVFEGGLKTLQTHKPIIFTEMLRKWAALHEYHPNEIIDLLTGIGYKCFTLNGKHLRSFARVDENTHETNYFFLHPEKHDLQIKEFSF